jgi:hypothetical protein
MIEKKLQIALFLLGVTLFLLPMFYSMASMETIPYGGYIFLTCDPDGGPYYFAWLDEGGYVMGLLQFGYSAAWSAGPLFNVGEHFVTCEWFFYKNYYDPAVTYTLLQTKGDFIGSQAFY